MGKNDLDHARAAEESGAAEARPRPGRREAEARNGKIARLPHAIRTELNQRLRDGEKGTEILAWLNGLPEVRKVMGDHFAGAEVLEINLSRWRQGGYNDWLTEEQTGEAVAAISSQGAALKGASVASLTENIAQVMVARLAMELHRLQSVEDDEARFKCFRDLIWGFIFLRRGEAESERLKREQARKAGLLLPEEEIEKQFCLWAADPENKERVRKRLFMSKEQKEAAIDELLADDAHCWMADEEYIRSIGGKPP